MTDMVARVELFFTMWFRVIVRMFINQEINKNVISIAFCKNVN